MKPFPLKRRRFLASLGIGASSAVLGPVLRQIGLGVEGDTRPLRFLFVLEGNGLPPKQLQPPGHSVDSKTRPRPLHQRATWNNHPVNLIGAGGTLPRPHDHHPRSVRSDVQRRPFLRSRSVGCLPCQRRTGHPRSHNRRRFGTSQSGDFSEHRIGYLQ